MGKHKHSSKGGSNLRRFEAARAHGAKIRTKVIKKKGKKIGYMHIAIKNGKSVGDKVHKYKKKK